jgi:hypothetical protein
LAPGAVVFPSTTKATRWEGTSNGIHAVITLSPAAPKTGAATTFHVMYSSANKSCCGLGLLFGDGLGKNVDTNWSGTSCPNLSGSGSYAVDHAWNKPGHRWIFVQLITRGACNTDAGGYFYLPIDVGLGGPPTSQGPSLPYFATLADYYDNGHGGDRHWLAVLAEAYDTDGYPTHFTIDWGDGSPVSTIRPADPAKCENGTSGWPAGVGTRLVTPTSPAPTHHYPAASTYVVTVTVFSTGCDGTDEQHAAKTLSWYVPV